MGKYFEVKQGCDLYNKYFQYVEDKKKVKAAFRTVCDEFGIEANEFYPIRDFLKIVPTKNDMKYFERNMKKNYPGVFKKASQPCKRWVELVKDLKYVNKPSLFYYMNFHGSWMSERLFHIKDRVYASFSTNSDIDFALPGFAIEMKASEFYKMIEDNQ